MTSQAPPPEPPDDGGDGRVNFAAIVFIVLLVVFGIWLINALMSSNEKLNCVASGRTNCAALPRP